MVARLHTFEVKAVDTRDNKDPVHVKFSYSETTANGTTSQPQQNQECRTTGGTSPISGSYTAVSTNNMKQSGTIDQSRLSSLPPLSLDTPPS